MKQIFITFLIIFCMCAQVEAAIQFDKSAPVAVMDMGTHKGTSEPDFNLMNAEIASSEYVISRLVDKYKFNILDKDSVRDKLQAENLNLTGIIDPDTAKRIGEILGVKYIVYGNVVNVALDENTDLIVKVRTVKANLVLRIMDVASGQILMAAKGVGNSQSASVLEDSNVIVIGTVKVSQTSVHNALQKAAYNAVDVLVERLK